MIGGRTVCLLGRPFIKSLNSATFVSGTDRSLAPVDVQAPKRATTPYNLFIKDKFQVTKESNPSASKAVDVVKLLAAQWKSLSDEQKMPYVKNSLISQNERAAAIAKLSVEDLAAIKKQKVKLIKDKDRRSKAKLASDYGRPKRSLNSFNLFFVERRSAHPTPTSVTEGAQLMKTIVAEYNALDEKSKAELQTKAAQASAQYKQKLAAWERDMEAKGNGAILEKLKAPAIPKKAAPKKLGRRKKLAAKKKPVKKAKTLKKKKPAKKAATAGAAKRKMAKKVTTSRKKAPASPAKKTTTKKKA